MEDLQGGTLALEHRYDIDRRSGEYALVASYRATQHPFDRPVWVKVCEAPHAFGSSAMYERIKAKVLERANIELDDVPPIVDFGEIDTHLPFWVIERSDGVSLDAYVERHGTLAPQEAVEIAIRVATVVKAAHAAGQLHGGIAPRWVTVGDAGVTVEHFGVQPTLAEIRTLDGAMMSQDLLWSLPPEQFDDSAVDHAEVGDVWAIGALLYWMVSGVHPYLDDPTDTSEAMLRLRNGDAPPALAELAIDADLSAFVERAVAASPEERFASIADFLDHAPGGGEKPEPARAKEPTPAPVTDPEPPADRPTGVGTAFAVVLTLFVLSNLGWWFYVTSQEPEQHGAAQMPEGGPAILPVGVELRSQPEDATILRVDGPTEQEFGDVPLTLDPKSVPGGKLPIIVRHAGHRDVRMDVEAGPNGHQLTVHLQPEGEQASSDQ